MNIFKKIIFLIFFIVTINSSYAETYYHVFNITYTVNDGGDRSVSVGLVLVDIPVYRELSPADTVYNDILSHSKQKPFGDAHGRSTNAHETVHGINSEIRLEYVKTKKNINAFYAGAGKGIILENPNLTIRDIVPYIPEILRGYRFNLYFVKQLGHWNDIPTYPMDEWSAYIAGAECAVDDAEKGLPIEKSDSVSGSLEFSIYCTALALATKNKDPEYWKNNQQFKNAIQYYLIKSERIFFKGREKYPAKEQDMLLDQLRNHDDAKQLRDILLTEFQGVFVD